MEGPKSATRLTHPDKFQEANMPTGVGILDQVLTLFKLIFKWRKKQTVNTYTYAMKTRYMGEGTEPG